MVASSVLGLVTTVHLGLASLRNHRRATAGPLSALAGVSFLLAATPWMFPTVPGLVIGLTLHLAWFVACERLAPPRPSPARSPQREGEAAKRVGSPLQPQSRPKGFIQVPVLAVFDETADIKTIRMARPEGFEFKAGQFIAIRIRVDGKDCSRCYSVSSEPAVAGYFEISVKRQGLVSNALHATVRPGGLLSVRTPDGAFRYPEGDDRPIVLLAGGVGITPLMSMLRHAVHSEPSRPVTLIYCARSEADFAFRDELAVLARRHPQCRVHLASRGASSPDVYPGRIDEALIRTTVSAIEHSVCYLCGPGPMIDQMKTLLVSLGVPPPQVRFEIFEAAVAAAAAREESAAIRGGHRPASARHSVTCTLSHKTVPIAAGQTLLEAAEASGVALESMCRAGICGTCRTRVTGGDVECASDALSASERESGFVLACVATANSNCTIDI